MNQLLSTNLDYKKYAPYIAALATVTALYSAASRLSKGKPEQLHGLKEIPSPKSYPVVGHLLSLGDQSGPQVAKWHDELNSPIIKLQMGIQNWYMIADPYLAHNIFVSNGAEASARPYNASQSVHYSINQKGISFGEGKFWKDGRLALLTVLSPKAVEQYMDKIEKEADLLAERLIQAAKRDTGIDPIYYLKLYSLNVISHVSIGKSFNSVEDPLFKEIVHLIDSLMQMSAADKNMSSFLPIFTPIDLIAGYDRKVKTYVKNVRDPLMRKLIEEAVVADGPNIFKKLNEDSFSLDEDNKIVILNDLISGGTDTTSTSLAWAFAMLCNHSDAQKKMFKELDDFKNKNGRLPLFSDREEVPYSLSVMKECMRMKPTSPFGLPHMVTKDIIVDDYLIPKGSSVFCTMDKIHMNENFYPNAKEFIPERFMSNTKLMVASANGKVSERDHFNFGWGRRTCPGIYLAEVEMFCAFIAVFSRCRIEPVKDMRGNPIYPNIKDVADKIIVQAPLPYKIRFVERSTEAI